MHRSIPPMIRRRLAFAAGFFALALAVTLGPAAAQDATGDAAMPVIVELVDLGVPGDAPVLAWLLELHEDLDNVDVLAGADLAAATVDQAGLAALNDSTSVVSVRPARQDLRLLLDESAGTIEADALHLDGMTGAGRVVAVIDSGVDADHPGLVDADLVSSVVEEACFLQGTPTTFDPGVTVAELCANGEREDLSSGAPCTKSAPTCTHGTAVAGIISGDDLTLRGIAPEAGILSFRVMALLEGDVGPGDPEFPYSAYIPEAGVLAALWQVYELRNTYDIAAVNLSLGSPPQNCSDADWEEIVGLLTDAGIAVVAASGNSGSADSIMFPACLPEVISVGATEMTGDIASFTDSSSDLDLLAPGAPIETTVIPDFDPDGFAEQSGTSFASPHVAAAFALVDETFPSSWDVARRRNLLRVAGEMITRPTASPFDTDPRFPELRLQGVVDFEPFKDAASGFWVEAADWAKFTGVSTGVGGNNFGPDQSLTRAQAVTFLWRFMGSPDHGTNSGFGDVDAEAWYAAAVTWAADVGVTTGTSFGVFSPDAIVSRAQLATFMWRTVGEPAVFFNGGFSDLPTGVFYTNAVNWMSEHGITTGTSPTTFSPDDTVTRAQMVTFEFRLADADLAWSGDVAPPELTLF